MKSPVMNNFSEEKNQKMKPAKEKLSKEERKVKQEKKKRLIIRNLSFKVSEDGLKDIFSKYGKVSDIKIPLKDGKKRGFAFIQFEDTRSLIKAMKDMNFKEIEGRRIAIDYAIDKTQYQLKHQKVKEEKPVAEDTVEVKEESDSDEDDDESNSEEEPPCEPEDENEKRANEFLQQFDASATENEASYVSEDESSSSDDDESEKEEEIDKAPPSKKRKLADEDSKETEALKDAKLKVHRKEDLSEGKTVFLRNVAFTSTQESLRGALEDFGAMHYCLLCIDKVTGHPRGTAFVKFQEKEAADKLIEKSGIDPGVFADGRRLCCSPAMSREEVSKNNQEPKTPKDKRNLRLLKVGVIIEGSEEAQSVSSTDMAKRRQLEVVKKQKLRNVNFFVSDRRLMISHLPKTYSDFQLRSLFKNAVGKDADITEARIMRDFKKIDSDGKPQSRGFGFVCFSKHEHALKALEKLNNNPSIFTPQTRPIVEFSVENKMALLSQEKRREKFQMRNKRWTEEKEAIPSAETKPNKQYAFQKNDQSSIRKNRRKNQRNKGNEKKFEKPDFTKDDQTQMGSSPSKKQKYKDHEKNFEKPDFAKDDHTPTGNSPSKKQRKRNNQHKKAKHNLNNISALANKYKQKLMEKLAV